MAALADRKILAPFPVQAATLPDVLAGENVLGRARTGSGKTLAFGLPLLARLSATGPARPRQPRGLILVPTRELAQQVNDVLAPLTRALGLWMTPVYGGTSISRQISAMRRGVHLVVATPGRLTDLIERDACLLDEIEITVLDEADFMCDLGFLPAVKALLDMTPSGSQRLLFSATLDREVEVLVRSYLPEPVLVAIDPEVSQVSTLARHALESVDRAAQLRLVTALAGGAGRTLVFVRTQRDADRVAQALTEAGVPAEPLHGGMPQGARTRALAGFTDGFYRVLVATDVAARGIHVDGISLVLHLGPPDDPKTYQHRGGRTARAGADGADVLVTVPAERGKARSLLRAVGVPAQPVPTLPDDPIVTELAGPPAPPVDPATIQARRRRDGGRREGGRREGGFREGGFRDGARRDGAGREGGYRRGGPGAGQAGSGASGSGREGGDRDGGSRPRFDGHRPARTGRGLNRAPRVEAAPASGS
ncbi:helicase [Frankia sp. CcI49]|uniref:DEAD/DEAH box helicase n=1 Tax=unclassified Frankia TaxID=2632575 RepID=UPI0006CA359F|nr:MULTISPECIES: DEAD/DEAH box helicase [unclassified Frankia]ONH56233.1 helicase [Frankia sp. CcI49]